MLLVRLKKVLNFMDNTTYETTRTNSKQKKQIKVLIVR